MSTSREITIWCDGCTEWRQFSETTAVNARKALKKQGWIYRAGFDKCGECVKENQ